MTGFHRAFFSEPPAPCADCPLANQCASKETACRAFWAYVATGKRTRHHMAYSMNEAGKWAEGGYVGLPKPTRRVFERAMES